MSRLTSVVVASILFLLLGVCHPVLETLWADDQAVENLRVRPSTRYIEPKGYVCFRTPKNLEIDGKLDETPWQQAVWTDDFIDIEGETKPKPRFRTRVKMLWDDNYLYVAAELEEPHIWGTLTKHDSVIFHDNDFEFFVDPDGDNHNYGEFEINVLNTGWDLRLPKPYKDGGSADDGWEIPGLKTAIGVSGSVNDASNTDAHWIVEMAFPLKALAALKLPKADEVAIPLDQEKWRINFSRVEWKHTVEAGKYVKVPNTPEDNWVWSPQHTVNMHRPETWGYLQFSTARVGTRPAREVRYVADPAGPAKYQLMRIYYAQKTHMATHKEFADVLTKLDLTRLDDPTIDGEIVLRKTTAGFEAFVRAKVGDDAVETWHIDQDSRLWKE